VSRAPVVSIVTATYNRSHVLRHAIHSVLDSSFTDWEMIVVGDGCTDDSAACVDAIGDARVRFVNLPTNSGGQAAPNNHGIELARGRYVAFLNHDDLYLRHHLASCVATLERGESDLVWTPALVVHDLQAAAQTGSPSFSVAGVPGTLDGRYSPFAFYIASSWMMRRELAARVGPWRPEKALHVSPSQDWLFRASRTGARLTFIPHVGVLLLYAGGRPGSYAKSVSPDHDVVRRWLVEDPHCLERMLEEAAINAARQTGYELFHNPRKAVVRGLAMPVYALLTAIGVHPFSLNMAARHRRRGGYIRNHQRTTGARR